MEEQDFQVFDKLQADAVKKFYEVRVLQSSAEEDKNQRLENGGRRGKSLGCLLCVWTWTSVANTARRKRNVVGERERAEGPGEGWREY